MTNTKADLALLTEQRYTAAVAAEGDWYPDNILRDDRLLQSALMRHGISSVRIDWARPDVDWSQFRCAVFRTTWDYFERQAEFTAWLNRIRRQTRLCNDAALIEWNMDKHYLADLDVPPELNPTQRSGVPAERISLDAESLQDGDKEF